MSNPVQRPPQLTLGGQEAFELRNALLKAVKVIRTWHDIGTKDLGLKGTEKDMVWRLYFDNAPEMKEIREALERHA